MDAAAAASDNAALMSACDVDHRLSSLTDGRAPVPPPVSH